jgi:hypothetical protein
MIAKRETRTLRGLILQRLVNDSEDVLKGTGVEFEKASLLHFWQWAFSDLCDDDLKGIFAEWIVLQLLNIPGPRRISWANSDIITPDGVRLEVKATSYWQSWKLIDEQGRMRPKPLYELPSDARIRFSGLTARDSTSVPSRSELRELKSDLYVFAFQHEKDIDRWDAMDLCQWEFYLLPRSRLLEINERSISLTKLRSSSEQEKGLDAEAFVIKAREMIKTAADGKKALLLTNGGFDADPSACLPRA